MFHVNELQYMISFLWRPLDFHDINNVLFMANKFNGVQNDNFAVGPY